MKPIKINIKGTEKWRVKFPTETPGQYKQKTYKTQDQAKVAIDNFKIVQKKSGQKAAQTSITAELIAWQTMDAKLRKYRTSLIQVAQERFKQLEGVKHHETLYNAIAEFLISKKQDSHSPRYLGDLKARLNTFSSKIKEDTYCDAISQSVISDFLNQYANSTTRDNYRRALSVFFKYCETKHYVSQTPVPKAQTHKLNTDKAHREINILTVDEVSNLLQILDNLPDLTFRPYIAISLFCGIRSAEFRKFITHKGSKKEVFLTWGDVDLKNRSILISPQLSKCKIRRAVPIPDALQQWLDRWIKQRASLSLHSNNTPIAPKRHAHGYADFKKMHQLNHFLTPNCLRHSYGTYRTAIVGASKAATEMGNSEAVVTRHYANAVSESRATDFFALTPDTVIPKEMTEDCQVINIHG